MAFEIMIDMLIRVGLIAATAFLFSVVFLAYLRIKNRKMLFISLGFGTFLVNALIHIPELISKDFSVMFSENIFLLIEFIGLLFITIGLLKE